MTSKPLTPSATSSVQVIVAPVWHSVRFVYWRSRRGHMVRRDVHRLYCNGP